MNPRLPLTIIILTHRADDRFQQSLASAQFANEVLVLDFQSQNDWPELWKKHQFKVVKQDEPLTHFGRTRNQALRLAKYPWVFFLDSDEVIDPDTITEIRELIEQNGPPTATVTRQDVFYDQVLRHGETGNFQLIRLGQKPHLKFHGRVHEKVAQTPQTTKTKIRVQHHAHQSLSEFWQKITQYSAMKAKVNHQQQFKTKSCFYSLKLWLQLCFYSSGKFIYNYLFKQGFRDGWRGLVYALMMSYHSAMARIFQYELSIKSQID